MEGLSSIPACMVRYGTYHEIPSVNYLPVTAQVPLCGESPPKVSDGDVPFILRYWYGSARVMGNILPNQRACCSSSLHLFLLHFVLLLLSLLYRMPPGTTGRWPMRYCYYFIIIIIVMIF